MDKALDTGRMHIAKCNNCFREPWGTEIGAGRYE